MTIKISKEARTEAVTSLERYFSDNLDGPIGNLASNELLSFFLEEIGPLIYNQAVADVQQRLNGVIQELDIEIHAEEFPYWRRPDRKRKAR